MGKAGGLPVRGVSSTGSGDSGSDDGENGVRRSADRHGPGDGTALAGAGPQEAGPEPLGGPGCVGHLVHRQLVGAGTEQMPVGSLVPSQLCSSRGRGSLGEEVVEHLVSRALVRAARMGAALVHREGVFLDRVTATGVEVVDVEGEEERQAEADSEEGLESVHQVRSD